MYMPVANEYGTDLFKLQRRNMPSYYGLSRKLISDWVKHSLIRFQLGYIDLLQCCPPRRATFTFYLRVEVPYVQYVGASSFHAWQCMSIPL
ncbi:hypothetical protein PLICRDRAFT_55753 [Plicaturopsis crispa FD-325 SS-3]|nr:hypothetical protein PLICRDRAFT_55753 [Plicaturopsis crispa FD-325 SS-3]